MGKKTKAELEKEELDEFLEFYADNIEELMSSVYREAKRYFKGYEEEFSIEHVNETSIIFGYNHVITWTIYNGFVINEENCEPAFLEDARKARAREIISNLGIVD